MISVTRAKWLKNRLADMGPAEVCSRLADVGRHVTLRTFLGRIQNLNYGQVNCKGYQERVLPIMDVAVAGTGGKEGIVDHFHAHQWLSHKANFFSLQDVSLGDPIDWHRNYASGVRGPMKYSGFIDHRDPTLIGDVKYVWELNRLQHLVLLGLAFGQTSAVAYRDEIVRQTLSWISSNPFMMGVNWKSPLEAALRLISWASVSCLVGNQFPPVFHEQLTTSIYQHQYFIWKFFSKHSSANNHLIGEMTGLYVASVIWPLYRESKSWRAMARQTLIREMFRQVGPDGVGRELATEYQLFILEFLLMAAALGQVSGDPFPQPFWHRLSSMLSFLSAICDGNGNFPMFGDGDSGQVIALPQAPQVRARSLLRLGGLNRERNSDLVESDARTRLLLWGQSPENVPLTPEYEGQRGLRAFPQGGYYVLAEGQDPCDRMMVIFDAGPLGFSPLYAHGHADALSFWLSYGGQEFFVDPGTFCYYGQEMWRDYFRSTAAHNTLRLDGQDQSVPVGRFQWSHVARCEVLHTQETDEWIEIEAFHDGYRRLRDPVIHRRSMRLFKRSKKLLITDQLICIDRHDVEIYFHFHENCRVTQTSFSSFTVENHDMRLRISLDALLMPEVMRGSERPILGWMSRSYGIKTPSPTIIGRALLTRSKRFLTEILPA